MWTSIKLDSQVNSTLREIQLQVEKHLIDCPDTPLPPRLAQYTDRKSILDAWVTRQEAWNIAVKGRSTTDLFFVLLCNAYAVTRLDRLREISETANGAMILKQLKLHAATLTDQKPSIADTQELFEQCAAVVVWTLEHCAQDTLDTTIAFGLDFGDPNDVYKGKDETKVMQQDDDDGKGDKYADELKKSQQEDEQLKVARDFLPWCSRFFFEHWFEQQLFKQFPVDEKFDWFKVNQARPKFDHWITKQLKTSLPKAYENRLKVWIYRMLLGVGSMSMYMRDPMRQGRRAPDLDDVFLAQETQTTLPYEKWVSDSDNSKMLQTPAADIAILAAYVTVFDASIQGLLSFFLWYFFIVFCYRDELRQGIPSTAR
jgi:hypothetical protein